MRTFNVFVRADAISIAIKQGWSWPAFIFGHYWALLRRLWILAIIIALMENVVFKSMEHSEKFDPKNSEQVAIIGVAVILIIRTFLGLKGNKLREKRLLKKRFVLSSSLKAKNAKTALKLHVASSVTSNDHVAS